MTTTMAELKKLAKAKGLMVEQSHALYNAYLHIKADDTDGLEGRPDVKHNIIIMTTIDPKVEEIVRDMAKVALENVAPVEKKVKKRKKKSSEESFDIDSDEEDNRDDNRDDSFESRTQKAAKKNLAASLD